MRSLSSQQWIPYPVDEVFHFLAQPVNLPRLMPSSMSTRVDRTAPIGPGDRTDAAGSGSEIEVSFKPFAVFPYRLQWVARTTAYCPNDHFCNEQVQGPFTTFTHWHGFTAEQRNGIEGTLVRDEIEFTLPLGWFGALIAFTVAARLRRVYRSRRDRLLHVLQTENLESRAS